MIGKIQNCALPLFICILSLIVGPRASAQEATAPYEHPISISEYDGDVTRGLEPKVTLVPYESQTARLAPDVEDEAKGEFGNHSKQLDDIEQKLLGLTFNFLMQCNARNALNDAEERWCINAAADIDSELKRADSLRNALHQRAEQAVTSLRVDPTDSNEALKQPSSEDKIEPTKLQKAMPKPKRRTKPAVM